MKHMNDYLRAGAAQSLKLLRESQSPGEVLVLIQHQMQACREMIDLAIKVIHAETRQPFSAEGVAPVLEQSHDLLLYLHEDFRKRLEAARSTSTMAAANDEQDAYPQAISAVLAFNDAIGKLREAIIEHNRALLQADHPVPVESEADTLLDGTD